MSDILRNLTRELRKKQTPSEKVFWETVRNRGLGVKFVRQYAICFCYEKQNRFFIADFYCAERKLVVEIDGKIHEDKKDYDDLRTFIINNLGIKVVRFKNEELADMERVKEQLRKHI